VVWEDGGREAPSYPIVQWAKSKTALEARTARVFFATAIGHFI
jgi:hypothetical protein